MKTIGNIIWFLLIGIGSALGWWLMGLILCITIIGIPFGTQCFKIGTACLTPVGKIMDTNFDAHPIANIFWLIFFGWESTCINTFGTINSGTLVLSSSIISLRSTFPT